jgi:hypothetical protein
MRDREGLGRKVLGIDSLIKFSNRLGAWTPTRLMVLVFPFLFIGVCVSD